MTGPGAGPDGPVFRQPFLVRFLAALLAILAAGSAASFLALRLIFTKRLPSAYPGIHYALRDLSSLLTPILAFSTAAYVLLMGVAVALLCVRAFHRVAGPIFRMECATEILDSGDPVKPVFLREQDQLVPLGHAFNRFVDRLRKDRQDWIDVMEHAERLCLRDPASCLEERREALGRLSALLSRYR